MSAAAQRDIADFYRDDPYPGRRLIAFAVVLFVVDYIFLHPFVERGEGGHWWAHVETGIMLMVTALYFLGFWRGVRGKGYPRVLFLMSFVPLIGLIILNYLPAREEPA